MSEKLDAIIDNIAELSVLELSELIKALEEKFGVEAAAPMAMAAMPAAAAGDAGGGDAEPTSFNVVLKDHGSQKIAVIKVVKEAAGLGLKEAKALVDECPKPVKEGANKEEANALKEALEGAGATVELEPAG
jgi:large subunit ribosomal protein L7/L12